MAANSDQRLCSIDGCSGKHHSGGMCGKHYVADRRKRGIRPVSDRVCSIGGCGRDYMAKGLCKQHYKAQMPDGVCEIEDCTRRTVGGDRYCCSHRRRVTTGTIDVPIRGRDQTGCLIETCDGEHYGLGLCRRHYRGGRVDRDKRLDPSYDPKNGNLVYKYGISRIERDMLFMAQDGLCAICRMADAAHIDHDHNHGCSDDPKRGCRDCVRGGLCARCNTTLSAHEGNEPRGAAQELLDNPWWTARANFYLRARPFSGTYRREAA